MYSYEMIHFMNQLKLLCY